MSIADRPSGGRRGSRCAFLVGCVVFHFCVQVLGRLLGSLCGLGSTTAGTGGATATTTSTSTSSTTSSGSGGSGSSSSSDSGNSLGSSLRGSSGDGRLGWVNDDFDSEGFLCRRRNEGGGCLVSGCADGSRLRLLALTAVNQSVVVLLVSTHTIVWTLELNGDLASRLTIRPEAHCQSTKRSNGGGEELLRVEMHAAGEK